MSRSQITQAIESAVEVIQEKPQPLRKQQMDYNEFPIDSLPQLLKGAVLGLHDKIQAPIAICAQSVLAVTNLVTQGHADILLPMGQQHPISCFFLTIAESGERKSSCDNEVLSVIEDYEAELNEQYKKKFFDWQNNQDAWQKQRDRICGNKKNYPDRNSMQEALDQLGKAPEPPLTPTLICSEPTFEGLCKLMATAPPSLGIFSSEGGQFIGGYSMKDDNKIRTAAAICEVWDGKTIKRVRGGDGTTILGGRRLSMHLMVQPNIANTFLSDPVLRDQGILSRILVSSPKSAAGTRLSREVKDTSINALEKFKLELNKILHLPLPIKAGCLNELQPKAIILSTESKELYHEFANNIEKSMLPNGAFEHIKGLANKLPEHVLRIAATFALFEDISVTVLEYKYVKMATKLCEYYSKEALRLATEGTTDPNILLAEKLLDWLHNNWEEDNISLPDIYQRSLNKINTKAIAVKIVSLLVGHGCLRKNEEVTVVKGQSRKDSWKIIKP